MYLMYKMYSILYFDNTIIAYPKTFYNKIIPYIILNIWDFIIILSFSI